jgi:MATE family multidrug resistance protein
LSRFGEAVVAAHSIAININGLTFMIPHALGMAAAIRVGHQVGGADNLGAKITGNTTVRIILIYSGLMAILLLLLNAHIAALYTDDTQVQTIAASIIIFVAVYQFIDNTQATALGTLRGYKDTRIPLVFVLVAYWIIALPIGLGLGFGWILEQPMGFSGFWIGLGAGLLFASLSLNFRRLRVANDDKRIRVLTGSALG